MQENKTTDKDFDTDPISGFSNEPQKEQKEKKRKKYDDDEKTT